MSLPKVKKKQSYAYNFMVQGYREHVTIKDCSEKQAKKFVEDRKTAVYLMLQGTIEPDTKVKAFLEKKERKDNKIYTIEDLCKAVENDYIKKKQKTTCKVITHSKFFFEYFGKDKNVKELYEEDMIDMVYELKNREGRKGEKLSDSTINKYMNTIKRGYKLLNKNRKIKLNHYPFNDNELDKKKERGKEKIIIIPPEKEQEFFNAFPTPQNHIVEFDFNTGLRISNVLYLNKSQIDLHNNRIKILAKDNKGKKDIDLKLNKRAKEIIMLYYNNADYYIFTHLEGKFKGKPYTRIDKSWKTAAKVIGLDPDSTPHDGRRSFATKVYNKTKDIYLVQRLLGHSRVEVTIRYLGLEQSELDKVIDTLND